MRKQTLPILLALGVAVFLSACSSFSLAPAIYEESRSNPHYWSLILTYEGQYYLTRLSPNPPPAPKKGQPEPVATESEQGTWTQEGNKVVLKNDAGTTRTLTLRLDAVGHYLVEDGKGSPPLRWTTEEIGAPIER